jgi:hypothetical protein
MERRTVRQHLRAVQLCVSNWSIERERMRPSIIDDEARAKAARVLAYAEAHPCRAGGPTPGDDPNFVADFDIGTSQLDRSALPGVFTFTHSEGRVLPAPVHLSAEHGYPNPVPPWPGEKLAVYGPPSVNPSV